MIQILDKIKRWFIKLQKEREFRKGDIIKKVAVSSPDIYCFECGGKLEGYPFKCARCKGKYCDEHRLPENHGCVSHGKPRVGMSYGSKGGVKSY
jgi:predicted nucleic acid binding AN1-type Zn finger protein